MIEEVNFTQFLDDGGRRLDHLKSLVSWRGLLRCVSIYRCLLSMKKHHGLYNGSRIKRFLEAKIRSKLPNLDMNDLRFHALEQAGCLPLKVIATDVVRQLPCVFGSNSPREINESVIDAVRASTGYPFVFEPVKVFDRRLVDGGLCSNLPIFAFEEERKRSRTPIIAFDLVPPRNTAHDGPYSFSKFCADMINTSLQATDVLLRDRIPGVVRVCVPIPAGIDTLDFSISKDARRSLYDLGRASAYEYFTSQLPYWDQAKNEIERLQAIRSVEPDRVQELLSVIAHDVMAASSAENVRCAIMLPTERSTRIVVYQINMDHSADVDLEIPTEAGCTGQAWRSRAPAVADLDRARETPEDWGLTVALHNRVPVSQKSMISLPLFDLSSDPTMRKSDKDRRVDVRELGLLGTLSLDSSTPLADTDWLVDGKIRTDLIERLKFWGDVVSKFID